MSASNPAYLVQTADNVLHAYYTLEVLLIDLSLNKGEPVNLFKLEKSLFKFRYVPCTEQDLRKEAA